MARLRKFIKKADIMECVEILQQRFPGSKITLDVSSCGIYRNNQFTVCVASDTYEPELGNCLMVASLSYGNLGFEIGPLTQG